MAFQVPVRLPLSQPPASSSGGGAAPPTRPTTPPPRPPPAPPCRYSNGASSGAAAANFRVRPSQGPGGPRHERRVPGHGGHRHRGRQGHRSRPRPRTPRSPSTPSARDLPTARTTHSVPGRLAGRSATPTSPLSPRTPAVRAGRSRRQDGWPAWQHGRSSPPGSGQAERRPGNAPTRLLRPCPARRHQLIRAEHAWASSACSGGRGACCRRLRHSRAIWSSSFVGMTYAATLLADVVTSVSPSAAVFASASISTPRRSGAPGPPRATGASARRSRP